MLDCSDRPEALLILLSTNIAINFSSRMVNALHVTMHDARANVVATDGFSLIAVP